jgi:hypothetical protein
MDNSSTVLIIVGIVLLFCICIYYRGREDDNSDETETETENFEVEIKPGPVRAEDLDIIKTVSPERGRIGEDSAFAVKPLVDGAFLVVSHHESGCVHRSHNIYLAVRNDGSVVYNDKEFGPHTLEENEVERIHELMIEKDFFNKWYKVKEPMYQSTTKFYSNIYYTDGRIYATLTHIPSYITDLVRSLEVRYRLKSKAHTEPIGKFVY